MKNLLFFLFSLFSFLFSFSAYCQGTEAVKVYSSGTDKGKFVDKEIVLANEKLVRVADYGADPTGQADSVPGVMAAYEAMKARGLRGLYFGPGTFLLSTTSGTTAPRSATAGPVCLDFSSHDGDLILEGGGAKLITALSGSAQRMVQIVPAEESINIVRGFTFERNFSEPASSGDDNALDAILLMPKDNTSAVPLVRLESNTFINCHRAWTAGPNFWYARGLLKKLEDINNTYLYPSGANSEHVGGGGQASYNSNWVDTLIVNGSTMDGAANDLTGIGNELPKDGLVFSFGRVAQIANTSVKNFGAEGLLHCPQDTIAFPTAGYTMPNVGEDVTIAVPTDTQADETFPNGTNVSLTGTNTNFFTIQGWSTGSVTLRNTGTAGNSAPSTSIGSGLKYLKLANIDPSASLIVNGATLDGTPAIGYDFPALTGISAQGVHAEINNSSAIKCASGITLIKWPWRIDAPNKSVVNGFYFSSTYNSHIGVAASTGGVVVQGSTFLLGGGGSAAGVNISSGTNNIITGNFFSSPGSAASSGIAVSSGVGYSETNNTFRNLSGSVGGAGSLADIGTNLVLTVNGTTGHDQGIRRGTNAKFRTITAAKNAAQAGDTINVEPGVYDEANLFKNGITLNLQAGASIVHTGTTYSIIDNSNGGVTSTGTMTITGQGRLIQAAAAGSNKCVIHGETAGSVIRITAAEIANSGTNTAVPLIRWTGSNATLDVNVPLMNNTISNGAGSILVAGGTVSLRNFTLNHASAVTALSISGGSTDVRGAQILCSSTTASNYPIGISSGTLRLTDSYVKTFTANRPVMNVTGGVPIITNTTLVSGTSASNGIYASSGTTTVRVFGVQSNKVNGTGITEAIGTVTVSSDVQ
jgi:hypothetical protein